MSVKISKTNSKLGIIPSVNIPPVLTCRCDAPCTKDCYALKGRFRFPNVKANMFDNYNLYKSDPTSYFRDICSCIDNGMVTYSFFRWHAAGDIVDRNYLLGMVDVANKLERTSFLVFTKKFELVNEYIKEGNVIPPNLHIVFSAWGTSYTIDNPYNFPIAYVRLPSKQENVHIPLNAVSCSGNCTECLQCWHLEKGKSVVFNKH